MGHKIKKQIDESLRLLANSLPKLHKLNSKGMPIRSTLQELVTGKELLAENPKAKDKRGNPIDPNKKYHQLRRVYVDHYRELRAAYVVAGQEGVEHYVEQINVRYRDAIRKYKQPHRVIMRFIKKLFKKKADAAITTPAN